MQNAEDIGGSKRRKQMTRWRAEERTCDRKVRGKRMNGRKQEDSNKERKEKCERQRQMEAETKKSACESSLPKLILTVGQGA